MQKDGSMVQAAHSGRHLQVYYVLPAGRLLVCSGAKQAASDPDRSLSLAVVPP